MRGLHLMERLQGIWKCSRVINVKIFILKLQKVIRVLYSITL